MQRIRSTKRNVISPSPSTVVKIGRTRSTSSPATSDRCSSGSCSSPAASSSQDQGSPDCLPLVNEDGSKYVDYFKPFLYLNIACGDWWYPLAKWSLWQRFFSIFYCFAVGGVALFYTGYIFSFVDPFADGFAVNSKSSGKTLYLTSTILIALTHFNSMWMQRKFGDVLRMLQTLSREFPTLQCQKCLKYSTLFICGFQIIFVLLLSASMYICVIGVIWLPFPQPSISELIFGSPGFLDFVILFFLNNALTFPTMYLFLLCLYIYFCTMALCVNMRKGAAADYTYESSKEAEFSCLISYFHRKYHILLGMCRQMNELCSRLCFINFSLIIPLICLCIFSPVADKDGRLELYVIFFGWAVGLIFFMFIIFIPAIMLQEKRALKLFVLEATSMDIGISVGGIGMITRGMVLQIFGSILTYFLLLVQFSATPSSTPPFNSTQAG